MNDTIDNLANSSVHYEDGIILYVILGFTLVLIIFLIIKRKKNIEQQKTKSSKFPSSIPKSSNTSVRTNLNDVNSSITKNVVSKPTKYTEVNPKVDVKSEKIINENEKKVDSHQSTEEKLLGKDKSQETKKPEKIIIPKNPTTTFVNAKEEEQNRIKFIGYEPSIKFEQREPYNYPMVFMPKPRCVIKFPRKGKQGLKGYTEAYFKDYILECFKRIFQVYDDRFVLYKSNQNPFEPDFSLIDEKNDLNLFIDIEIDEPYDGISRQPIHYVDFDKQRDSFFMNRGWVIIRFAEYQVFKEPLSCCKLISEVVKSINPDFVVNERLENLKNLRPIKQWTKEQALIWAKERYREKYLGIDRFVKQEHRIILNNLQESRIGEGIEEKVEEENVNSTTFKHSLIKRAIQYNNYLSCKTSDNYTVIKPEKLEDSMLTGYCYLKNSEINFHTDQISDIILRDKPFVFRINGEVGATVIKSFIANYIKSKNPIRLKYTKSNFGLLQVDIETGEVILPDADLDSLRTITDFNIVSKVHPPEKITQFKLNDNDYISGFCHLKNELRTFKYERINELEILNI